MTYDNFSQGLTIRHTHKSYGKGCIITYEAQKDDLYFDLAKKAIQYLGQSHRTTEEYVHANILNNGFTVAQNHQEGGDGQYLFDSDHVLKSGTFSNLLASASLSRTTLQDAITQVQGIKDESGVHFSSLEAKQLVVPLALEWEAKEILKSMYQPENANNGVNLTYDILPLIIWKYLTSNTAWFITTNAPDGFVHYEREKQFVRQSNDDDTMNAKIQSYSRYISGVIDVRGGFGNLGA
jgi:phage major head subunit gpT-like protein